MTRIVQITDPHLLNPGEKLMTLDVEARWLSILEDARRYRPDAYFFTGDFCAYDPQMEVYHRIRPQLDALDAPYYLTAGNHDSRTMMRNAFYLEGHGEDPIGGLIRVKDRDFLFLDSSPGTVDGDQVTWLRKALSIYPRADIVMHHPPVDMGVTFMDTKYPLRDTEELLGILSSDGRKHKVFCGHYHCGRTVETPNLQVFICPPTSFYINPDEEEFTRDEYAAAYRVIEYSEDGCFRTFTPGLDSIPA